MPECWKKLVRHQRLLLPAVRHRHSNASGYCWSRISPALAILFYRLFYRKNWRRETSKVRMSSVVSASSSSSQADHFMQENKEEYWKGRPFIIPFEDKAGLCGIPFDFQKKSSSTVAHTKLHSHFNTPPPPPSFILLIHTRSQRVMFWFLFRGPQRDAVYLGWPI